MYKSKLIVTISWLFIITIASTGCKKQNLKNAEKSLDGDWKVEQINSSFGERSSSGIATTTSFNEEGDLGNFEFNDETLDYKFTRLDTLYEANSSWTLSREKVNAGFTKAEQYTLQLNEYDFICVFGDATKNAEKKATEIKLFFETTEVGPYHSFELKLSKI